MDSVWKESSTVMLSCAGGTVTVENGSRLISTLGEEESRHKEGSEAFSAALDGLESFLLALVSRGVINRRNLSSSATALNTAYNAICENFPDE